MTTHQSKRVHDGSSPSWQDASPLFFKLSCPGLTIAVRALSPCSYTSQYFIALTVFSPDGHLFQVILYLVVVPMHTNISVALGRICPGSSQEGDLRGQSQAYVGIVPY